MKTNYALKRIVVVALFSGGVDSIAEGAGPAPEPVPTESRPCPPFAYMCP